MASTGDKLGQSSLFFLGAGQPTDRGAVGYHGGVASATEGILGQGTWPRLLYKTSSVVTDGKNANMSLVGGLWYYIDTALKEIDPARLLLKIWSIAHRADLVWEDTAKTVPAIENLMATNNSLGTYSRWSGMRTQGLQELAQASGHQLVNFPRCFEARWTQCREAHLSATLTNYWHAVLLFLGQQVSRLTGKKQEVKEAAAANGFQQLLLHPWNLQIFFSWWKCSSTVQDMHVVMGSQS